jgi:hypothetical protein
MCYPKKCISPQIFFFVALQNWSNGKFVSSTFQYLRKTDWNDTPIRSDQREIRERALLWKSRWSVCHWTTSQGDR